MAVVVQHVVTNDGVEAPRMKDLHELRTAVVDRDRKIDDLTVALKDSNDKFVSFANALVECNKGLMVANDRNHKLFQALINANNCTTELANRLTEIAEHVFDTLTHPQLLHSLGPCAQWLRNLKKK